MRSFPPSCRFHLVAVAVAGGGGVGLSSRVEEREFLIVQTWKP